MSEELIERLACEAQLVGDPRVDKRVMAAARHFAALIAEECAKVIENREHERLYEACDYSEAVTTAIRAKFAAST
jgi:hypothetical protein